MDLNLLHSEEDLKMDIVEVNEPICRCCLSTEKEMRDVVPYEHYFMELAGISVMESDGLPQWLCWECAALLQKSVCFKLKMLRAHNLLYESLSHGASFPVDAAEDPELRKYASPHLSVSETQTYSIADQGKMGFQEDLTHKSPSTTAQVHPASLPSYSQPLSLSEQLPGATLVKIEDDADVGRDDDLAEESRVLDEDLQRVLEAMSAIKPKQEPEPKKKKEIKGKEEIVEKKKPEEGQPESLEPSTSIMRKDYLVPTKIRIVKLDPVEQMRQKEEANTSNSRFPFVCFFCFEGFNFKVKLENHMKKHSPSRGRRHKCKYCHTYSANARTLRQHLLSHTQRYECVECKIRMTKLDSIMDHYRSQHEGMTNIFKCKICGKLSNNRDTHISHMHKSHGGGERPKCDQCGKSYLNKVNLIEHLQIHQNIRNFECEECGKRFRTRGELKIHKIKHKKVKNFYCAECDIGFKLAFCLKRHLKTLRHKGVNSFKFNCDQCEKRYETERALRKHVLTKHKGVRDYRCDQCPAAYTRRYTLKNHIDTRHRGVRPRAPTMRVCDTCGKAFKTKHKLTCHMRTHTGEKPFACERCGRGFSRRCSMQSHVKNVHHKNKTKGVRDYRCDQCPAAYAWRKSLDTHIDTAHRGRRPRTPTMRVCETCGKGFKNKADLTRHMRTHTGEKLFACELCGRGFSDRSNMQRHVRDVHLKNKTKCE